MIFHENRLLADDSHVISYLYFCRKLGKVSQNLSSAAVVIGAFRVKVKHPSEMIAKKKLETTLRKYTTKQGPWQQATEPHTDYCLRFPGAHGIFTFSKPVFKSSEFLDFSNL